MRAWSLGVAFVLLLVAAGPAGARVDPPKEGEPANFRLTVRGDPPPGDTFQLDFGTCFDGSPCRLIGSTVLFCGGEGPAPPCEGGGKVYAASIPLKQGQQVQYEFVRWSRGDDGKPYSEAFAGSDHDYVPGGATYSATYTYPIMAGTAQPDGAAPGEPPTAGAGGAGGMTAGRGALAGGVALVVAVTGWYAALRRRRLRARRDG